MRNSVQRVFEDYYGNKIQGIQFCRQHKEREECHKKEISYLKKPEEIYQEFQHLLEEEEKQILERAIPNLTEKCGKIQEQVYLLQQDSEPAELENQIAELTARYWEMQEEMKKIQKQIDLVKSHSISLQTQCEKTSQALSENLNTEISPQP